jgi:hypothetical protein
VDSNASRVRRADRFAENKAAFDDVIGDPYAYPEPIDGQYARYKQRSSIRVANNDFDSGHATPNTSRPSPLDFFCDVERAVEDALTDDEKVKFLQTYIWEEGEAFSSQERIVIEQKVGQVLRDRKISPVTLYFRVVRQSVGTTNQATRVKEYATANGNIASSK